MINERMIEQPYRIAKYPVTNLQYRRFIDANGYETRDYWSDVGWAWRTGTYDSKITQHERELYWHTVRPRNATSPSFGMI